MKKLLIILMYSSLMLCSCEQNTDLSLENVETSLDITETYNILSDSDDIKINTSEEIIQLYSKFIKGEISVDGIDISFINMPKGEPDRSYGAKYAVIDLNGDRVLDLHVRSARYYYIFTVKENEMVIWKTLHPNPPTYALNNGAFISWKSGGGAMHDNFSYRIYDCKGNEIYSLGFSKYDIDQDGFYSEKDEYLFDGVNVTKIQWDELTERYLYIDENNHEQIRNEIEWTAVGDYTNLQSRQ